MRAYRGKGFFANNYHELHTTWPVSVPTLSPALRAFFRAREVESRETEGVSLRRGSFASSSKLSRADTDASFLIFPAEEQFQVARLCSREARENCRRRRGEALARALCYKLRGATRPTSGVLIELQASHYLEFHRLISKSAFCPRVCRTFFRRGYRNLAPKRSKYFSKRKIQALHSIALSIRLFRAVEDSNSTV